MFREKLSKLIDVKSIMTLSITGAFIYLTVKGSVDSPLFMNVFVSIVSFYFGTQKEKQKQL